MTTLTEAQVIAIEDMIQRRMDNTGETREEACDHITNYLINGISFQA